MTMKNLSILTIMLMMGAIFGLVAGAFVHRANPNATSLGRLGATKWTCFVCSFGLDGLIHHLANHSESVDVFIENHLCTLFNDELLKDTCIEFVEIYGDAIITGLMNQMSSDEICQGVGLCDKSECRLRPKGYAYPKLSFSLGGYLKYRKPFQKPAFDPWQWLNELLDKVYVQRLPAFDLDNDGFSDLPWLRGSSWRGKDCNDLDPNIHPGRRVNPTEDKGTDFNCNGIKGIDPESKKPWKDVLCEGTNTLGVAVVGDSAGAHFGVPASWFNLSEWNLGALDNALYRILHELDLPHYSGYTGFVESTDKLPVRSVYKYLRETNLCNHRDFQNVAVNGGTSSNTKDHLKAFRRDPNNDHPMIVFLELIGNDVCKGPTKPADFKKNILSLLDTLNSTLPKGSHVVMIGLVNGSLLYENLHERQHPAGIPYADFYEYLTCQGSNPCKGWLTKNDTARAASTKRAFELNAQYKEIVEEGRVWENFDYVYYDLPTTDIIEKAKEQGIEIYDLIEPVDGFHPGQLFHAMLGDWLWEAIKRDRPMWIGESNPNNQRILQLFGDQGGY